MNAVVALLEVVSVDLATEGALNVDVGAVPPLDFCGEFSGRHCSDEGVKVGLCLVAGKRD